jgi:8-oxo-dGTP pyrophosphatase MutT (NUDIX family)
MEAKPKPKVGTASDGRLMHYSAGAIIEDEQGRVLLLDRKYEPFGFAGMAGHIDEGEDPLTALMREGHEEIGTELQNVRLVREEELPWNYCRNDGVNRVEVHYWCLYRATVNSGDVRVDPHEAKRWGFFGRGELPHLVLEPVWEHWLKLEGYIK